MQFTSQRLNDYFENMIITEGLAERLMRSHNLTEHKLVAAIACAGKHSIKAQDVCELHAHFGFDFEVISNLYELKSHYKFVHVESDCPSMQNLAMLFYWAEKHQRNSLEQMLEVTFAIHSVGYSIKEVVGLLRKDCILIDEFLVQVKSGDECVPLRRTQASTDPLQNLIMSEATVESTTPM